MGKGITVTKGYVATLKREKCVHRVGGKKGGRDAQDSRDTEWGGVL